MGMEEGVRLMEARIAEMSLVQLQGARSFYSFGVR